MTRKTHAIAWLVLIGFAFAGPVGCGTPKATSMSSTTKSAFGQVDGQPVDLYTLTNRNGLVAKITNYGAILTELHTPDRDGEMADIVLGYQQVEKYVEDSPYFGATVGRVANRIAQGRFTLDDKEYELATNNGPNHLHGGIKGLDKVIWTAAPMDSDEGPALKLIYTSPDGEEGYPGNLAIDVIYTLTNDDELKVEMVAETDKPTPVNLAHHSYWNLAGHDSGTILGHRLVLNADQYTPTDKTLIPTGKIEPVAGTPFDFRHGKRIGLDIGALPGDGEDDPGGYDVNFVLNGEAGDLKLAAVVHEPTTDRVMEIHTTEPGIQFYSGNFLSGHKGKDGASYDKHDGFCLETQHYPDSINKPDWPSVVLRPGKTYRHLMIHRFYVRK